MDKNVFLPDINNEYPHSKNKTYKENLLSLNKLVLIKFAEDETVRPAESAVNVQKKIGAQPIDIYEIKFS
jgi:palmitoyl-protein thioesterase